LDSDKRKITSGKFYAITRMFTNFLKIFLRNKRVDYFKCPGHEENESSCFDVVSVTSGEGEIFEIPSILIFFRITEDYGDELIIPCRDDVIAALREKGVTVSVKDAEPEKLETIHTIYGVEEFVAGLAQLGDREQAG